MRTVYLLSHHDDELGAWPLINHFAEAGAQQTLIFMTASGEGPVALRRQQETRRALAASGIPNLDCVFLGHEHDIPDGQLHRHLPRAGRLLLDALPATGDRVRLVTHAWEGGHTDHDMCFALAGWLLPRLPAQSEFLQFSLYHMRGLRWPLYRAAHTIPENGPSVRAPMPARVWMRYMAAARHYPSQWRVLLTLWPSMFATFALQGGYRYQLGRPERVWERPHPGPLMYEQVRRGTYDDISARIAQLYEAG